jgi:hypothetical protein
MADDAETWYKNIIGTLRKAKRAMDPVDFANVKRIVGIFMPKAQERLNALHRAGKRVVHYTSAENLLRIITSKQLWMRNTNCMADYSEVTHGHSMLQKFFQGHRDGFGAVLHSCHPGLADEAIQLFDQWWGSIRFNTYICSISEHEDYEDQHGRLSMWRAFGGNAARAALVMNVPPEGMAEGLHLFLVPVAYEEYPDIEAELLRAVENVRSNTEFLKSIDRDRLKTLIFYFLVCNAVSIKHQGFREEKEWRVIYLPHANPSKLVTSSIEVIGGVPQIVHQIPLHEDPNNDVVGVGISALVNRIIIGPTVYNVPMHMAFTEALAKAGVAGAANRVVWSGIPIRPERA